MNRSLFRYTAFLQLGLAVLLATGCAQTQPFFLNESPDLQHYLNAATAIEYPDVQVESLPGTLQTLAPLTLGNHDYEFWNLTLEECVSMALQNSKFFLTTSGTAEFRQNIATQFVSGQSEQFGSVYDVAIQQTTTQSAPLAIDGNGNRLLPRGVVRANQVGGVEDALAEFDAQASSFIDFSTTDRAQNVGAGNTINPQFATARNATQQAALSKRLATGGVATLREQVLYSANNTLTQSQAAPGTIAGRAVGSDYTAILEAQIQHPLMRNRGTLINRTPVVLASLNEDISVADFEIQVRNLVRDVENAYWDLYVAYRNVSTAIIGRNSAQATQRFAELQFEEGVGNIQELSQAREQYFQFRARVQAALAGSNLPGDDQLGVYGRERALRALIGLEATDGRLIRPINEPSLARLEFDWNESVAQMLYLSPELRQNKYRIKQNELELMLAKNQILPDVNLSFLYRWVGVGDTLGPPNRRDVDFPAVGSSALAELTGGQYQELGVRLEFTPTPIGSARELARVQNAKLRLQQAQTFLQEAERMAVNQLSDAVAKVSTHYQLVQTNAQRWQAAEQEVEARLIEYEKGLSAVNVVLQSQQRRADAQITYYRALTEYNKSLNYVEYLKGTMLANSAITLREGVWNSKAYLDALERARERAAGYQLQYGVTRPGVVRTGPVRDGDAAVQITGSGAESVGAHVPPSEMMFDGPMGSSNPTELDWVPADSDLNMDEVPLSEMGTPREMFSPEAINNPALMPKAEASILLPTPPALQAPVTGSVAPMSYQSETVDHSGAPAPVSRRALPVR
ncbi:TolC family protein [Stieleria varia]|uniref:Outer membrane efflux protein n=1 Tax=Stieleria varia TaxID=2528005 RepID=A0A5C6A3K9_9BACT|nr:TolC family protein [Stieleria varia]TWT93848.1 Outer membrane efflux protein [Stieleria varia]